ncbi:MAG: transcription antitermination factor NusB [Mycoplasmoidaceae bacterium]
MLKQWEKRIIAFQYIYSCLMKQDFDFDNIPDEIKNDEYIFNIVEYSLNNFSEIKKIIISNLSENWKWDRVSEVDLAIIVSIYSEYKISKIDRKILIDQAIITSKNYSDEKSYKFINSILDRMLSAKV